MHSARTHSGDLSHDSSATGAHRTGVGSTSTVTTTRTELPASRAERNGKRFYNGLSASSAGLELGLSVMIALLFGWWLDSKLGTGPWLMLAWLPIGLAAGFRGVLREVRRADRAAQEEAEASRGQP